MSRDVNDVDNTKDECPETNAKNYLLFFVFLTSSILMLANSSAEVEVQSRIKR